jgi:hypothetical protein
MSLSIPSEFQNNHILDYGKDGDGIIRDIARDIKIPPVMLTGNYRQFHWYELCKILHDPNESEAGKLKVKVAQSYVIVGEHQLTLFHGFTD